MHTELTATDSTIRGGIPLVLMQAINDLMENAETVQDAARAYSDTVGDPDEANDTEEGEQEEEGE
jgi:hypothetical protein